MKKDFPVLVVEDNDTTRKHLQKTLEKAGYEVVTTDGAQGALELMEERFFPMLLSDWLMPGMDGLELCRTIRKRTTQSYVYIIILTTQTDKENIIEGLDAGADDYLLKPFHYAELVARLNAGTRILELERSLRKANEEVKILSITDALTRCYNRGYITEHLPQEISRAKRYSRMFSLILCDIDNFKRINDHYGHQAGDDVLKRIAGLIQGAVRKKVDWVARYGGEEFIIVLPETPLQGAYLLAERLRRTIFEQNMEVEGDELSMTISLGVVEFNPDTADEQTAYDTLIRQADKYMYQAKKDGRNLVRGPQVP